ncbi:hypothetical protein [Schumannella luteola]
MSNETPGPTPSDETAGPVLPPPTPVAEEPAPQRPSRTVLVLSIIIAVLVAAGAGIGVFAALNAQRTSDAAPESSESAEPVEETSAPGEEAEATEGVLFTSEAHGYEVRFPGEPTVLEQNQALLGYELVIESAQWVEAMTIYTSQGVELPAEIATVQEPEVLLEGSIGGVASTTGATVEEKQSIELDGAPAISALLSFETGQRIFVVVALHDTTLITLIAPEEVAPRDAFVSSFRFVTS